MPLINFWRSMIRSGLFSVMVAARPSVKSSKRRIHHAIRGGAPQQRPHAIGDDERASLGFQRLDTLDHTNVHAPPGQQRRSE
jgi:hypothetical protein